MTEIQKQINAGNLEVTSTRKISGTTWYADAHTESWWNENMTKRITKSHSRKWYLRSSEGKVLDVGTSMLEVAPC